METGRISEGCAGWSPGLSSSAKGKSGEVLSGNHIAHRPPDNHPRGGLGSAFSDCFSRDLRAPHDHPAQGWNEPPGTASYAPKITRCMMRPGTSVNRPATTSAPAERRIMIAGDRRHDAYA